MKPAARTVKRKVIPDYIVGQSGAGRGGAYHHGNLRADLVAAARDAVQAGGPDAVSLKALARALGVSQPAPYRHFADREAVLVAVATDAFGAFIAALRGGASGHAGAAAARQMARAYLAFGRDHRGLYRLMFASSLVPGAPPDSDLRRVADDSFGVLLQAVAPFVPGSLAMSAALGIWAALHGLVMLQSEGLLSFPAAAAVGIDELAEEVVTGVLQRVGGSGHDGKAPKDPQAGVWGESPPPDPGFN